MVEDDRLRVFRAPVLVEDVGAVAGGDEWHGLSPFPLASGQRDRCRSRSADRAGWLLARPTLRNRSRLWRARNNIVIVRGRRRLARSTILRPTPLGDRCAGRPNASTL